MLELIVRGVGVPIGIAVVMLAAFVRPWRRTSRTARSWVAGAAVSAAFAGAYAALFGWPSPPPPESWQWLPYLLLPVAILGAAIDALAIPGLFKWLLVIIICLVATWMLIPEFVTERRIVWIIAIALSVLAIWLAIVAASRRIHPAFVTGAIMVMMTGASIFLVRHSGNAKLGQLAGALAAPLGVCLVVAIWRKQAIGAVTLAAPVSVAHVGLIACGYFNSFSETPFAAYLLITLSPVALLIVRIGAIAKLKPWQRATLIAAPCVVAITVGLLIAENAYSADAYAY